MQIRHTGWVPTFRSVKMNENFIIIAFNNHSEVCVWDSRTFDLVGFFGILCEIKNVYVSNLL